MIELFGRDSVSVLGVATMLETERIAYRFVDSVEPDARLPLLVAGGELRGGEVAAVRRRTALVLGGGASYARDVFGAPAARVEEGVYCAAVAAPPWSAAAVSCAHRFGQLVLRLPLAPACRVEHIARGTTLTTVTGPTDVMRFIVRHESQVWSAVDLGAAFANLLAERYLPAAANAATSAPAAQALYYAAPQAVRQWLQRYFYRRAARRQRLSAHLTSQYPVDATGWLLLELLLGMLRLAFGDLVRAERWPGKYRSAATLTHDLEPTRFPYSQGLDRLLDGAHERRAVGAVALPCERFLSDERRERLLPHEIYCHGFSHRGDAVTGRQRVGELLRLARQRLERRLGRPVRGYRSPRLDRSDDLLWALDQNGFDYDSSFPDIDRENLDHFGGGVRWNLPYRPVIRDGDGAFRFSRCLELPLTAPDCIQPLFTGDSPEMLRETIRTKAEFIRQTAGVYVSLVHAGVFGARDAELRGDLLDFVIPQLRHAETWLATPGDIVAWWRRREGLQLALNGEHVEVTNGGDERIDGVRVRVERGAVTMRIRVPPLDAGETCRLPLAARGDTARAGEWIDPHFRTARVLHGIIQVDPA